MKNKGCNDGCAFYGEDWALGNLSHEDQIALESQSILGNENDPARLDLIKKLVVSTNKKTCIGGLIKDGNPKQKCKYFTVTNSDCGPDALVTAFTSKYARSKELPWRSATLILGIATVFLGVATYRLSVSESEGPDRLELQGLVETLRSENQQLSDRLQVEKATCNAIQSQLQACTQNSDNQD